MIISKRTLPLLLFLLILSTGTLSAYAQEEVRVSLETTYDYGSELRFLAEISSPSPVSRAALFYRTLDAMETEVTYADLQSGEVARALAVVDLHSQPLPPFSTITYWWHFDFADSIVYETTPERFDYIDNRFEWNMLEQSGVSFHWVDGDLEFGQSALNTAVNALSSLETTLALPPPPSAGIYVYPTPEHLRAGLQIGGRIWVAGHSQPELGVILLAAPGNTDGLIQLEHDIPHELTHLLLYERMGESYKNLPSWLNEGIAVLQEPAPDSAYLVSLEEAAAIEALIPLESLCSAFPFAEADAVLAYGESASFVVYLRDIYGVGGIVQLLDAYQEGASCTGAVERIYQRPLAQLESEWRQKLSPHAVIWEPVRPLLPWALIVLPAILISISAWIWRLRRSAGHSTGDET